MRVQGREQSSLRRSRFLFVEELRMSFLDAIETQLVCNRLPLAGISVAAVPHADTPVVLSLHWHAFVEHKLVEGTEEIFKYEAVPSSCLQLNERWRQLG